MNFVGFAATSRASASVKHVIAGCASFTVPRANIAAAIGVKITLIATSCPHMGAGAVSARQKSEGTRGGRFSIPSYRGDSVGW